MNALSIDPGPTRTGVYLFAGGRHASFRIERAHGQDAYEYLAEVRHNVFSLCGMEHVDAGLVEDYPYTKTISQASRAVEVGAVVREAFATARVPVIVIAIPLWKSLTIGVKYRKGTIGLDQDYLRAVIARYGVKFATTDEADAFMIYQAALRVWQEGGVTEAQVALRDKIAAVLHKVNGV